MHRTMTNTMTIGDETGCGSGLGLGLDRSLAGQSPDRSLNSLPTDRERRDIGPMSGQGTGSVAGILRRTNNNTITDSPSQSSGSVPVSVFGSSPGGGGHYVPGSSPSSLLRERERESEDEKVNTNTNTNTKMISQSDIAALIRERLKVKLTAILRPTPMGGTGMGMGMGSS